MPVGGPQAWVVQRFGHLGVGAFAMGSAVLGATAVRQPIAHAASAMSVVVANSKKTPVPVREQNTDTDGNIKVHEHGTATVKVNGVATTQPVQPANSLNLEGVNPTQLGCNDNLPAGTQWVISSLSLANLSDVNKASLRLGLLENVGGIFIPDIEAPTLASLPGDTVQLTFPQPFVLTASQSGECLAISNSGGAWSLVGYRT